MSRRDLEDRITDVDNRMTRMEDTGMQVIQGLVHRIDDRIEQKMDGMVMDSMPQHQVQRILNRGNNESGRITSISNRVSTNHDRIRRTRDKFDRELNDLKETIGVLNGRIDRQNDKIDKLESTTNKLIKYHDFLAEQLSKNASKYNSMKKRIKKLEKQLEDGKNNKHNKHRKHRKHNKNNKNNRFVGSKSRSKSRSNSSYRSPSRSRSKTPPKYYDIYGNKGSNVTNGGQSRSKSPIYQSNRNNRNNRSNRRNRDRRNRDGSNRERSESNSLLMGHTETAGLTISADDGHTDDSQ